MLIVFAALAITAFAPLSQTARETYEGGPLGFSRNEITDARANRMLDPIEADLSRLTGKTANVREVAVFNTPNVPESTFCGTVSYDGGPWISFIMRSPPRPLVEPIISVFDSEQTAIWRDAGCDQDGSLLVQRP